MIGALERNPEFVLPSSLPRCPQFLIQRSLKVIYCLHQSLPLVLFQKSEEGGTGLDRETFKICLELLEEDANPFRLAEYVHRLREESVPQDQLHGTNPKLGSPMKH